MDERQDKHNEALALNQWVRANYGVEEDVEGNDMGRMTPAAAARAILWIVTLLWVVIGGLYLAATR